MKISIVIPVYNGESTIQSCLDSIIEQNYPELEVLVVNDHSADGTADIVQEYANLHDSVKVIVPNTKGVSGARNAGILHATGDVVGFCDADDRYANGIFKRIANVFENNSEIRVVSCGYETHFVARGKDIMLYRGLVGKDKCWDASKLLDHVIWDRRILGSVSNKFFKKELLEPVLFDETLHYFEDTNFVMRVIEQNPNVKACIIPDVSFYYIQREDSATHDIDRLFHDNERLQYNLAVEKILADCSLSNRLIRVMKGFQCRLALEVMGQFSLDCKQKKVLQAEIKKTWMYYPFIMVRMPVESIRLVAKAVINYFSK